MYSFESVLERHHSYMCHLLLNNPKYSLLSNLSPEDKIAMQQVMTHAILSTDMARHAEGMSALFQCAAYYPPFRKEDKKSRNMLIASILHCAGTSMHLY